MDAKILNEEYVLEAEFAEDNDINPRTSARYRNLGMPYMEWGGRIYIHIPGAKKWAEARIRSLNPRRA